MPVRTHDSGDLRHELDTMLDYLDEAQMQQVLEQVRDIVDDTYNQPKSLSELLAAPAVGQSTLVTRSEGAPYYRYL